MSKKDNFYFVYHRWNGKVMPQLWWGDVETKMVIVAKFPITEEEFRMPLRDLEAKYPFKE